PPTNAAACRPAALPPARTRPSRLRARMGHTPPRALGRCARADESSRKAVRRAAGTARGREKAPQRPRSGLPAATLQAGVAPSHLRGKPAGHPGAKALDVVRRPRSVAGHGAVGEAPVDALGVGAHVVVG